MENEGESKFNYSLKLDGVKRYSSGRFIGFQLLQRALKRRSGGLVRDT